MADPPARIGIGRLDQLADRALPVADDRCGHPLGDRGDLAANDQAAIVVARDVRLDDQVARTALAARALEGRPDRRLVAQVQVDAPAVVPVERFDHAGIAQPDRRGDGGLLAIDELGAGGTGRPAESRSLLVRLLSEAMSTAIADVREVIVARIRC